MKSLDLARAEVGEGRVRLGYVRAESENSQKMSECVGCMERTSKIRGQHGAIYKYIWSSFSQT